MAASHRKNGGGGTSDALSIHSPRFGGNRLSSAAKGFGRRDADGNVADPLRARGIPHTEFHTRGGRLPRDAAGPDQGDQGAGGGAWRAPVPARGPPRPAQRFRALHDPASAPDHRGGGGRAHAGRELPAPRQDAASAGHTLDDRAHAACTVPRAIGGGPFGTGTCRERGVDRRVARKPRGRATRRGDPDRDRGPQPELAPAGSLFGALRRGDGVGPPAGRHERGRAARPVRARTTWTGCPARLREMVMQVCESERIELYARFRSEREDWVQAMVLAGIGFRLSCRNIPSAFRA